MYSSNGTLLIYTKILSIQPYFFKKTTQNNNYYNNFIFLQLYKSTQQNNLAYNITTQKNQVFCCRRKIEQQTKLSHTYVSVRHKNYLPIRNIFWRIKFVVSRFRL